MDHGSGKLETQLIKYEKDIRNLIKMQAELRVHIDIVSEKLDEMQSDNVHLEDENIKLLEQNLQLSENNTQIQDDQQKQYEFCKE